jgi:predicted RecB family nuclease
MQYHNDDDLFVFSASDLNRLRGCARANALEIDVAMGRRPAPPRVPSDVYSRAGLRHEAQVLEDYIRDLGAENVVVIEPTGPYVEDKKAGAAKTLAAVRAGIAVIHQGVLWWDIDGATAFLGYADFLVRQPDGSYQVIDTKLAKEVKEKYLVQIGMYAIVLRRMSGLPAIDPAIQLGTKEIVNVPLEKCEERAEAVTERFLDILAPRRISVLEIPRGRTCDECKYCRWRPDCAQIWDDRADLGIIAGVGGKNIDLYESAGFDSIDALAAADIDAPPDDVSAKLWKTHVRQARLQAEARKTGVIPVEVINRSLLDTLPQPAPGDLYFDIEGYAMPPLQLEYLFGLWDGETFVPLWAHSASEEAKMLTAFVDEVQRRRLLHPNLRIYYYNSYETQALRRLAKTHAQHEEVIEELCTEIMINLMPIVKGSIMAGIPGYGLKELERLHGFKRSGEIKTASDSVELYDQWLYSEGDRPQDLLDQIAIYNLEDLQSTQALHQWLSNL